MLEPDEQTLLLDALRPPSGMTLDRAVGTTFSLDLEALLLAPVAFALFDRHLAETGDLSTSDPLALFEAVRRHADRIDLFCQAGQIAVPPRDLPILAYLEESVHQAAAPDTHFIFHPKVWVLKYETPDQVQQQYRLLVLSRNLTFNRSWDTIVQLDGERARSSAALTRQNQPLVDFVAALPDHAVSAMRDRAEGVRELANELGSVAWELPEGFSELSFRPAGIPGYTSPALPGAQSLLVISPFLSSRTVKRFADTCPAILVSRPESLDRLELDLLARFQAVYQLADGTTDLIEQSDSPPFESTAERAGNSLVGLHAKAFVAEENGAATLWSGSANATDAGWGGNIEFSVGLSGAKQHCGVQSVLGDEASRTSLRSLLVEYHRLTGPVKPTDSENFALDLEHLGRELACAAMTIRVEPSDEFHRLIVTADRPMPVLAGVGIRCWPATLPDTGSSPVEMGQPLQASFTGLSLQAITSFIVFELKSLTASPEVAIRLVVNGRLLNAPEDRLQRILTAQLHSKSDVLRYLLLLLADLTGDSPFEVVAAMSGNRQWGRWGAAEVPLFESMVKALSRSPHSLDHIFRLIEDLSATEEGRALLPDGLDQVWPAVWQARQEMRV